MTFDTTNPENSSKKNLIVINSRGETKEVSPIQSANLNQSQNLNKLHIPEGEYPKSELLPTSSLAQIKRLIRLELEGRDESKPIEAVSPATPQPQILEA